MNNTNRIARLQSVKRIICLTVYESVIFHKKTISALDIRNTVFINGAIELAPQYR